MADDRRHEQLEAYLDQQLDADEIAAFEAALAADPDLARELDERRAFRREARAALADSDDLDLDALAHSVAASSASPPSSRPRAWRRARWPMLAAAAVLCAAVLGPRLLRDDPGAPDQHPTMTRSGQVVALRFGEQPGAAIHLEAGCYHQSLGECP